MSIMQQIDRQELRLVELEKQIGQIGEVLRKLGEILGVSIEDLLLSSPTTSMSDSQLAGMKYSGQSAGNMGNFIR